MQNSKRKNEASVVGYSLLILLHSKKIGRKQEEIIGQMKLKRTSSRNAPSMEALSTSVSTQLHPTVASTSNVSRLRQLRQP